MPVEVILTESSLVMQTEGNFILCALGHKTVKVTCDTRQLRRTETGVHHKQALTMT